MQVWRKVNQTRKKERVSFSEESFRDHDDDDDDGGFSCSATILVCE